MDKNNLLLILEELMKESYFHCEWSLEWEERENIIRLNLQIPLANPDRVSLYDSQGLAKNKEEIIYEVELALYNSKVLKVGGDRYLASIPVDDREGIAYGELVALVKYLKQLTSSAQIEWRDFIKHEEDEVFQLSWSQREFESIRKDLMDNHRYSHAMIYFPNKSME